MAKGKRTMSPQINFDDHPETTGLILQERFAEAAELCDRLIERSPKDPALLCLRGVALDSIERPEEAGACFEMARSLDPSVAEASMQWGHGLLELGRAREALLAYGIAIHLDPTDPDHFSNLGTTWYALGRLGEAAKAYLHAADMAPGNELALVGLGNVFATQGRNEDALKSYELCAKHNPNSAFARNGLGNIHLISGRWEQALREFDQAIRIDPGPSDCHNGRGYALMLLDRDEAALASFDAAVRVGSGPSLAAPLSGRASVLGKLGRREEALEAYGIAIELDPSRPEPWMEKARLLAEMDVKENDHESAIQCLCRSLLLESRAPMARDPAFTRNAIHLLVEELHAPLLLHMVVSRVPEATRKAAASAEAREQLRCARVPSSVLGWLEEQRGSMDELERLLLRARTQLAFGDAPGAHGTLEELDDLDSSCPAGQLYYLWAMDACLEPERECAAQQRWAQGLLERWGSEAAVDPLTAYYLGHLARLVGDLEASFTWFERAMDDHPAAVFMAWLTARETGRRAEEVLRLQSEATRREVEAHEAGRPCFTLPFEASPFDPNHLESRAQFEHALQQFEIEEAVGQFLSCESHSNGDEIHRVIASRSTTTAESYRGAMGAGDSGLDMISDSRRRIAGWRLLDGARRQLERVRDVRKGDWIARQRIEHRGAFEQMDEDPGLSGQALERAAAQRIFLGLDLPTAHTSSVIQVMHAEGRLRSGQAVFLMLYAALRAQHESGEVRARLLVRGVTHTFDLVVYSALLQFGFAPMESLIGGGAFGVTFSEKVASEIEDWFGRRRRAGDMSFPSYDRFQEELIAGLSQTRGLRKSLAALDTCGSGSRAPT